MKQRLRQMPADVARIDAVRMLVAQLAPRRDLFREYYSFDVVRSVEARRSSTPPDVKPLP